MNKDEILEAVNKLLFEDTAHLNREEYRELLHSTIDNCKTSLNALDEDEEEYL